MDHGDGKTLATGSRLTDGIAARWFQALYETPLLLSGILDARGTVLDANRQSIEGCGLVRERILGRPFWEGGWWSPDPELSAQVRCWCEQTVRTGVPLRTVSRYHLADGTRRMVDLAIFPVTDDAGAVAYLAATGSDITDALVTQRARDERAAVQTEALHRVAETREREFRRVQEAERRAEARLHQLVTVALALLSAESVEDLTSIVVDRSMPVLGADGGAVVVRESDGGLRVVVSGRFGERTRAAYRSLPPDSPLPACHTARTGDPVLLPTRAAGLAFTPGMADVYAATRRDAWAFLPLRVGARLLGSLAVSWREEREFSSDELTMLEAFAAQCAQALDRIQHLSAQRESALAAQRLSETLQRSLLTQPPTPDSLDIAVRYQPAAHEAQVGGDWYDAFVTSTGATMLVVGDVTGHDQIAVAAMGQIRNVLRGLAYDSDGGPAALLGRLDRALRGLRVGALASAVLARVEPAVTVDGRDVRRLCWSNAGHPPPLLRRPDGTVEVLTSRGLMLGVQPGVGRTEQVLDVPEGSTLLLYTDGLVERRDITLDEGIDRLAGLFGAVGAGHPEQVCDAVLAAVPVDHEDDIALLVVRCCP
ncbi:SpoIIE family protein phosphatase [Micromonospora echinofusca]|uniref:SpoIIE family protein phosphatase n=1 Tax=Micromonospora echinofusca TaxID=47858 RepID=A0ABS3W1P3_MICEH|nr:SpoIIE family protein phosphatase [Micromonospora echinofusca]